MKHPSLLAAATTALGLACAGVLWWVSRPPPAGAAFPEESGPAAGRAAADSTRPRSTDEARLPPALLALLATLMREIDAGRARPNEAVLTFKDDQALRRFLGRTPAAGLTVTGQLDGLRTIRVRFDDPGALTRALHDNAADFSSIAANGLIGIPQPPARQERPDLTAVPFGNETLAFLGAGGDRTTWGRGTTLAILDTGVAADATFGSGRIRSLDLGYGYVPGTGRDDGHGTAVAALAAGAAADAGGVAPGANLLSIRVTDAAGQSDLFTLSQAIVAAVDQGAAIINISLGGYATGAVLDAAITYATQKGAVIVAAAGNDQAAQLAWPAADRRVVSVGAIDRAEQQVLFSNSGEQLQLTAPGYGVQTAWLDGRRVYVDGTSASAPLVAGAIAAVMSQNVSLSARQAADLLIATANDAGAPGTDASYGHGIINLATALNRNNPSYIDSAVSSHSYDAATGEVSFVIQNRSGRALSGLALDLTAGTTTTRQIVPSLAVGETFVARMPVNESALKSAGSLTFSSRLVNPIGLVDQVPANNVRTSVLSAGKP